MTGYSVQSCRTCSCDKAPSADAVAAAAPVSSHSSASSPPSLGYTPGNLHTNNIDVGTAGNLDQPGAAGANSPAALEPAPASALRTAELYAASQTAESYAASQMAASSAVSRTAASSAAAPAPASAESYDIQQGGSLGGVRLSFDPPALTAPPPPPQPVLQSVALSDSGSAAGIGSQSSALDMMAGGVSYKAHSVHDSVVSPATERQELLACRQASRLAHFAKAVHCLTTRLVSASLRIVCNASGVLFCLCVTSC